MLLSLITFQFCFFWKQSFYFFLFFSPLEIILAFLKILTPSQAPPVSKALLTESAQFELFCAVVSNAVS